MSEPDVPVTASVTAKLDKKKSIILGLIGLAVIVLIFWKVIPQIGSYEDAVVALEDMGVAAMIVIVVSVVDVPDRVRLPLHGRDPRPAVLAIGAAQPGGVRHQQRRPRWRRLRPRGPVRDARDVQDPGNGRDGGDHCRGPVEHLRQPRAADPRRRRARGGRWRHPVRAGRPSSAWWSSSSRSCVFVLVMRSEPLAIKVGHLGQPPRQARCARGSRLWATSTSWRRSPSSAPTCTGCSSAAGSSSPSRSSA